MFVCDCVHVIMGAHGHPEESNRDPEAEVAGGCVLPATRVLGAETGSSTRALNP